MITLDGTRATPPPAAWRAQIHDAIKIATVVLAIGIAWGALHAQVDRLSTEVSTLSSRIDALMLKELPAR